MRETISAIQTTIFHIAFFGEEVLVKKICLHATNTGSLIVNG